MYYLKKENITCFKIQPPLKYCKNIKNFKQPYKLNNENSCMQTSHTVQYPRPHAKDRKLPLPKVIGYNLDTQISLQQYGFIFNKLNLIVI